MSGDMVATVLEAIGRRVLERLGLGAGAFRGTPSAGDGSLKSGAAGTVDIDSLLPPRVGPWRRARVNDRLGGLDRGGVFAGYDVDGHEVRVTVRRAPSAGQAARMVDDAPRGDGHAAWVSGAVWYYASGGTVLGDEDPTFGPGDVEAFVAFVPRLREMLSA